MDKVQIYTICLLSLGWAIRIFYVGKGGMPEEFKSPFRLCAEGVLALAFALPLYGRIFGWW